MPMENVGLLTDQWLRSRVHCGIGRVQCRSSWLAVSVGFVITKAVLVFLLDECLLLLRKLLLVGKRLRDLNNVQWKYVFWENFNSILEHLPHALPQGGSRLKATDVLLVNLPKKDVRQSPEYTDFVLVCLSLIYCSTNRKR